MTIKIIGTFDPNQLYCTGSFTKLLTTYVSLSLLAEEYDLNQVLDDENFLDKLCTNDQSKEFLHIFQKILGGKFTIRDLCTYYAGLPYTFDISEEELEHSDEGMPFKHHCIPDEQTFLYLCQNRITAVYPARSKFHYSELSIIFLGYLIEKIYNLKIETLYLKYIIEPFNLRRSLFSRVRVKEAYCQDLSDKYDYPAIAIQDHGFFCYSNGYYTTLHDTKILIENLLMRPVFHCMIDISQARAASNRLLNGLTIEIRKLGEDVVFGYEGLSFSGCNIWAYSTKYKLGYLTFTDSEEDAYTIIYDKFGYTDFDKVPDYSERFYKKFLQTYDFHFEQKDIPAEFQGHYQRVKINQKKLKNIFEVGKDYIIIRNPEKIKYTVVFKNNHFCIKNKDNVHGSRVGLYTAKSGHKFVSFDGDLYRKISE